MKNEDASLMKSPLLKLTGFFRRFASSGNVSCRLHKSSVSRRLHFRIGIFVKKRSFIECLDYFGEQNVYGGIIQLAGAGVFMPAAAVFQTELAYIDV